MICAPKTQFETCDEIENMPDEALLFPSKIWMVLVLDEITGKANCKYALSSNAKNAFRDFFDKKSAECQMLGQEKQLHLVTNASKSRDLVLRLAPILRLIEIAIDFIMKNPDFKGSDADKYDQPLMPGSAITQAKFVPTAIKLVEAYQQQRDILAGEHSYDASEQLIDEIIDKDVLLFKGEKIKGASYFSKRNNPYSGMRCATEEYEKSFERLAEKGLGDIVITKGRNNKETKSFVKKPLIEIASNAAILDKFPKSVSFVQYENNRKNLGRIEAPSAVKEIKEEE